MAIRDIYETTFDEDVQSKTTDECPECSGTVRPSGTESVCASCGLVVDEQRVDPGLGEVRRVTSALELPEAVRDRACVIFRRAHAADLAVGRSIDGLAAASIYASTRCLQQPVTLDTVGCVARVTTDRVASAYRTLNAELDLPTEPMGPRSYVPRLASELEASAELRRHAEHLAEIAGSAGSTIGSNPVGFAGACIYMAANEANEGLTLAEVAEAADVSMTTLRANRDTLREAL